MKKFKVTQTHNPQDFFNGSEPQELARTYWTSTLEKNVSEALKGGFTAVITEMEEHADADV